MEGRLVNTNANPNRKEVTLKNVANSPNIQQKFREVLGDKAPAFIASVVGAVNVNPALQKANPMSVFGSAMVAATLNLSVVPTLGQAAIVPYAGNAQFQVMVRGLIQLAQRTGLYRNINSGEVYEDEMDGEDLLTGEVTFHRVKGGYRDQGKENKIIGYFAYIETNTGFKKTEYWTKSDIENHMRKFSKSYTKGPWKDNFNAMARKTVLKSLLNHYGAMSVDSQLAQAISKDQLVAHADGTEGFDDNPMNELIINADNPSDEEEGTVNASTEEKREITSTQPKNESQPKESAPQQNVAPQEETAQEDQYEDYDIPDDLFNI